MKLVIQRVKWAKVTEVETENIVGNIRKGLFILVGVGKTDTQETSSKLAKKCARLRIMSDKENKMNLSIKDVEGEILVVSQFTLYANTNGGNRPSFIGAADHGPARKIYEEFINSLRSFGLKVEAGSFGKYMEIESVADGPVTILIEN